MELQPFATLPPHWSDPVLSRAEAESLLAQPHHILLALGEAGQGGHILIRIMPHTPADILTLYVPSAHRRHGHGKILVEATIGAAIAAGCTGLTLEVAASNTAAIRLYTVCGLQQVAKRAAYYTNPVSHLKEDALVLALAFA